MEGRRFYLTPSEIWKCLLNFIPLHYLNPKGQINSLFFPFASISTDCPCGQPQGGAPSVAEGLVKAIAPLFFSKHPWMMSCFWVRAKLLIFLESHSIVCFKNAPRLPVSPVEALNIWWPFIYFKSFQIPSHSCDWGQGKRAAPEWPLLAIHYPIDLY